MRTGGGNVCGGRAEVFFHLRWQAAAAAAVAGRVNVAAPGVPS